MKKVRAVSILILLLFVAACATPTASQNFKESAYKSMVVAAESYEISMKTIATLAAQGIVKPAEVENVKKYARIYYDAYQTASIALYTYAAVSNADTEAKLNLALGQMSKALGEFIQIAKPYLERRM